MDAAPPQYGGAGEQALLLGRTIKSRTGNPFLIISRKKQNLKSSDPMVRIIGPYIKNQKLSNFLFAVLAGICVYFSRARIAHVHGAYYYGFTSILAAKLSGKKSVLKVTLLGGDDPASVRRLRLAGVPIGLLLVHQFRWADRVVALNNDIKAALLEFDADMRVVVMRNGVKVSRQEPDHRTQEQATVLFAGHVGVRKGADELLRAWPTVVEARPEARLILAGPVSLDIPSLIGDWPQKVAKTVLVLGPVSRDHVSELMLNSSVFVLPSRAEGLPNALIEALAAGLPVVASGIPVNRSTAGDAALYCDPEDPVSIAAKLLEAIATQAKMRAASLKAARNFDIEDVASFYCALYEELLGRISPTP